MRILSVCKDNKNNFILYLFTWFCHLWIVYPVSHIIADMQGAWCMFRTTRCQVTAVAVSLCTHTGLLVAQNWATFHSVFHSLCSQASLLAPEAVSRGCSQAHCIVCFCSAGQLFTLICHFPSNAQGTYIYTCIHGLSFILLTFSLRAFQRSLKYSCEVTSSVETFVLHHDWHLHLRQTRTRCPWSEVLWDVHQKIEREKITFF